MLSSSGLVYGLGCHQQHLAAALPHHQQPEPAASSGIEHARVSHAPSHRRHTHTSFSTLTNGPAAVKYHHHHHYRLVWHRRRRLSTHHVQAWPGQDPCASPAATRRACVTAPTAAATTPTPQNLLPPPPPPSPTPNPLGDARLSGCALTSPPPPPPPPNSRNPDAKPASPKPEGQRARVRPLI